MDTLEIFGLEYQNVAGFKATDDNNNILTFIRPTGTQPITVTQNGTTTVDVTAYENAQITANVPNTYAAADEGKVVSSGTLVSQTSDTVTANDTYDTTLINSLTVNVSGGGGGMTMHTGTFTPATNTTRMVVTGLDAPAMIVKFGIAESGSDGTTKITAGLYADGVCAITRTNTSGSTDTVNALTPSPSSVSDTRTVYNDGGAPTTATRIYATKTGFVVNAPSGTYGFKAGYTWNWKCWTMPET